MLGRMERVRPRFPLLGYATLACRILLILGSLAAAQARAQGDVPPAPLASRPLRYAQDIAAFEAADRTAPPGAGQLLLAGASTMRMWSGAPADLAPYPIVNRGFGGAFSTEVVGYMDRTVLPHRPRVVIHQAGGNDIWAGDTHAGPVARARIFVERLRAAQPGTPVVFLAAPLAPVRRGNWPELAAFNRGVEALSRELPRVWYVDINPALNQPDGEPRPDTYLPDALHPSPAGYVAMAKLIRPALDAAWKAGEPAR
jgi:lysophospholipase L1-like esterase